MIRTIEKNDIDVCNDDTSKLQGKIELVSWKKRNGVKVTWWALILVPPIHVDV